MPTGRGEGQAKRGWEKALAQGLSKDDTGGWGGQSDKRHRTGKTEEGHHPGQGVHTSGHATQMEHERVKP